MAPVGGGAVSADQSELEGRRAVEGDAGNGDAALMVDEVGDGGVGERGGGEEGEAGEPF